ncbi:glycosyl hydrolase 115 family protein [Chitinophagaceae bacterium LB-8]|uniref:Glycosyl hydrolase 115 family protein n=1 Tax=Paraflavisolibacter caeni TaxID=2982496 RepID=A0A9X2XYX1_9BACT|nr:glycosyl hydrolase 115 family protein [Paraflavisolibacter caeni]MCU7550143.1 glycosyl hydrolase 115 family protein [Paraflavisolibacter caeni]
MMQKFNLTVLAIFFSALQLYAQEIVTNIKQSGTFPVVTATVATPIYTDGKDHELVIKAAALLQNDIEAVTGKKPIIRTSFPISNTQVIIIGSLDHSSLIQQLIKEKKLNVEKLQNKWEAYQIQVVNKPFKGVEQALVIAGSDRRGTAYGVFELSRQMGVSPWYWWADVPVKKQTQIFIKNGIFTDAPKVKYRGIFINDEAPALSNWSKEQFGGFNHKFYEKVFELILRLKGNYLWPAMWGSAFYDDDSLNIKMADAYGIVIGTSHHEPLMRAHDEWRRYGQGKWNYDSNEVRLKEFWRSGMQRATNEKIVSIGMRGDGDEPMSRETATALLERIVKDQRQIIEEVTGKPASQTPQLWALYKEVQDYYDKGMRVPDDVTLLLCDDNWGNIRKLPKLNEKPRSGGYGIYYHFDYVGGPRNYKWINTNNIARVWEQMHLAYEYDARQIWIVNVGDIKPMEFPISFFLDYAWNPEKWNTDNLRSYYTSWAQKQFGAQQSKEIGDMLRLYSQYSARRKPELLDARTYNLEEWQRVVGEWNQLLQRAEKVNAMLPYSYRDAFFQLVLHPVKAITNLHQMYHAVALNHFYEEKNNALANGYADKAKKLYEQDSLITLHYHSIAAGKWNHMMSQTHIGYTYWQQPPFNKMPEVKYVSSTAAVQETVKTEPVRKTAEHLLPATAKGYLFFEKDGYVSIEAAHYTRAISTGGIQWKVIPDIGRTGSGITPFPVTATKQQLQIQTPHTEYDFYVYDSSKGVLNAYFSPTLNFTGEGLQYAISIDNEEPQVITLNKEENNASIWNSWVANNIIIKKTEHKILKPGKHTLRYYMVDPGIVLQKLVIDLGGLKTSYLGPQETIYQTKKTITP